VSDTGALTKIYTLSLHDALPISIKQKKPTASPVISVYAVRRSDSQWALLTINKHPKRAARLALEFKFAGAQQPVRFVGQVEAIQDRKSTRLNSSHVAISYAVSCL